GVGDIPAPRAHQPPDLVPLVVEHLVAGSSRRQTSALPAHPKLRQVAGWIVLGGEFPIVRASRHVLRRRLELVRLVGTVNDGPQRPVVKPVRIIVGDLVVPEPVVPKRLPQDTLVELHVRRRSRPPRITPSRILVLERRRPLVVAPYVLIVDSRRPIQVVVLDLLG